MNGIFHGGNLDQMIRSFGGKKSDWLDLSTGINPRYYPFTSPDVSHFHYLPDQQLQTDVLEAARHYYSAPLGTEIISANGSQALIQALPHIFPNRKTAILSPTYGEHAHCWRQTAHEIILPQTIAEIKPPIDILVVVNPNNPTGAIFSPQELLSIAHEKLSDDGLLVIDEAFCDGTPELSMIPHLPQDRGPEIIVLRSMGKFFGLAGLRLGFAICPEQTAEKAEQMLGPWCASGPAIAIANQALRDEAWIVENRRWLKQSSRQMMNLLSECGLEIRGRSNLFVTASHPQAQHLYTYLAKNHILVRRFPETLNQLRFGLCANDEQMMRLKTILEQAINKNV